MADQALTKIIIPEKELKVDGLSSSSGLAGARLNEVEPVNVETPKSVSPQLNNLKSVAKESINQK